MAKIKIKPENKGRFSSWARARGMTVQEAARKILRNREKYSPTLIKRALFSRNASKWEDGGEINIDSTLNKNKNVPFVKKIYDRDTSSIQIPGISGRSTHYMQQTDNFVYPTVQNVNGALQYMGDNAYANARKTGNYIKFKNDKDALDFAQNFKNSKAWKKFEDGGIIPGEESKVNTYYYRPMTDSEAYLNLAKRGMVGHGADSLTAQQWGGMNPTQRISMIGKNQGVDYTLGDTANKGGVKWWSQETWDGAKVPKGRDMSSYYLNAKKKTKYPNTDFGMQNEFSTGGNIFKTVAGAAMVGIGAGVTGLTGGLATPLGVAMASSGVGMMGQGISGFGDDAAAKRQANEQEVLNAQGVANAGQAGAVNPYANTFRTGGKFKGKLYGNKSGAGNALLMDGEIIIKPSGTVEKTSNPSAPIADNIATDLADNTKIISRRNSAPLLKDINKLNKAQKLKTGGVTSLTKNSLDRNINKYYAKLFEAYDKQEAKKMAKGGQYKFQSGGPYGDLKYNAPDTVDLGLNYDDYGSLNIPKESNTFYSNAADNPFLPGFTPKPAGTGGTDWGGMATMAGELAPTIYNLGQGLFGKREMLDAKDYRNPYEGQINSLMANRRYNIDPELAANERTFATTAANIRNLGGSRGRVSSNLMGAQNVKQFGDMSAYAQQKNMENQYRGEQAQMMYPLGRDRSMTEYGVDEGNLMTKAAGRNMIGSGATGIQNYLLQKRYMKNMASRDKLLIGAIKGYSPYASKWVPGMESYIPDDRFKWNN